jgi:hypothetical protein
MSGISYFRNKTDAENGTNSTKTSDTYIVEADAANNISTWIVHKNVGGTNASANGAYNSGTQLEKTGVYRVYPYSYDVDLYKHASYTTDKYSNGKYDTVIKLKNSRKKLERMIADYTLRYQAYVAYMKSRNGDWNDFKGRNDMSGLGLSPGDDDESAGWYYLGDTDTVDECKRQALSDDTLYTRIVHYTPDQGYQGTWQYGCYASVPGAKTSSNSRFNAIGVTTSDRTYWVDEPVATADSAATLPPTGTTNPASYKDWIYLGKYTAPSGSNNATLNYENGLHACKELAKNPASATIPGISNPAATYAVDAPFSTILYLDAPTTRYETTDNLLRYTCYGREGEPTQSNTVFLYKVNTTITEFSPTQKSGTLAYNNADQSIAVKIYLSVKDLQLKDAPSLVAGTTVTIQDPENTSRYQKWRLTNPSRLVWNNTALELTVTSSNDASYKFWSAPNDKNAVVILADTVPGVTMSYQTRCMDAVSGDAGADGGGNSGPPILKSQMVKDLQERYTAITILHQQITGMFTPIPGLSNTLRSEMDKAVAELKTLEPEARAKRNAVINLETNSTTMDEKDSHVRLHANRYVFVFYTIYAILFICGLIYLFRTDDDNAPAVKYVQTSLGVSVIILVAYHINQYYNYKS